MRFFFDEETDANLSTTDNLADYMEVFAFDSPADVFGQGTIKIVDAGRLLIDFSESGDGPGEVLRGSRKVYTDIIMAIIGLDDLQYVEALRGLAHRFPVEGEAMANVRIASPAVTRPPSTV
jgi:hypothetical protein